MKQLRIDVSPPANIYNMVLHENARMSHLPQVHGVENTPNKFDLDPVTLTYDLNPCDLDQ